MSEHPSLIRRPVLEHGESLVVGFDPQRYAKELAR
jgi:arsenate reductase